MTISTTIKSLNNTNNLAFLLSAHKNDTCAKKLIPFDYPFDNRSCCFHVMMSSAATTKENCLVNENALQDDGDNNPDIKIKSPQCCCGDDVWSDDDDNKSTSTNSTTATTTNTNTICTTISIATSSTSCSIKTVRFDMTQLDVYYYRRTSTISTWKEVNADNLSFTPNEDINEEEDDDDEMIHPHEEDKERWYTTEEYEVFAESWKQDVQLIRHHDRYYSYREMVNYTISICCDDDDDENPDTDDYVITDGINYEQQQQQPSKSSQQFVWKFPMALYDTLRNQTIEYPETIGLEKHCITSLIIDKKLRYRELYELIHNYNNDNKKENGIIRNNEDETPHQNPLLLNGNVSDMDIIMSPGPLLDDDNDTDDVDTNDAAFVLSQQCAEISLPRCRYAYIIAQSLAYSLEPR